MVGDEIVKEIVLVGFGGHAKSVIDSIEGMKAYKIAGYVDCADMPDYKGYTRSRNQLYEYMKKIGYRFPVIVDQSAIIASDAVIQEGTYIGKRAVINADARIGRMCIINTGAIIEHECVVGDFSHVAVGANLCGQCVVGENTFIGAGATVIQQRQIGNEAIVGAGCTIKRNIGNRCICKETDDGLASVQMEES